MAYLLHTLADAYQEFWRNTDDRVFVYPLTSSPLPNIVLTALYVFIVKVAGPWFMTNRQPYNIRPLMALYNFAMVLLSSYMVYEFAMSGWLTYYDWRCQPVDYSNTPRALRMVRVCWLFFISKYIEFLDTIFFVLRKKYSQVTFLHLVHHACLPVTIWCGLVICPGGQGTFFAMMNVMVHAPMYLYYGISALGPDYHQYLWWKKYMTMFQLSQFVIVSSHCVQFFFLTDCNYPKFFMTAVVSYELFFCKLFIDFYIQAYTKGKRLPKVQSSTLTSSGKTSHTSEEDSDAIITNGHIANGFKHE